MGYYMSMDNANFQIKKENKETALKLLKNVMNNNDMGFVDTKSVLNAAALSEAMQKCRYEIEEDNDGNVFGIYFTGEKLGDDYKIFQAIAPAVETGCYIQMSGEGGDLWRWVFKNGECEEITPKIIWEE